MLAHLLSLDDSFGHVSYVEIKAPPGYGGRHNSDAAFAVKQKWLWDQDSIYINKTYNYPNKTVKDVSPYLWLKTFTPSRYLFTDKLTKKRIISNWKPRSLQEFINHQKEK
jgi:hypothetical protein